MPARVVARLGRRREGRVGEGADRDDDEVRLVGLGVEDLRAALGAEVEDVLLPVRLVRDARVVVVAAGDLDLIRPESRLHPEGAAGPPLAGEAVADRDRERLARHLEAELVHSGRRLLEPSRDSFYQRRRERHVREHAHVRGRRRSAGGRAPGARGLSLIGAVLDARTVQSWVARIRDERRLG